MRAVVLVLALLEDALLFGLPVLLLWQGQGQGQHGRRLVPLITGGRQ